MISEDSGEKIPCLECKSPLSKSTLEAAGIVHCRQCDNRFTPEGEALTYVDEIPVDEFLGG